MKAIEIRGLTKFYKKLGAVLDLDLDVDEGTSFGFLGPNGAGKTTTMKMLTGLLRPTRGGAKIFGFDIGSKEAKRLVGYCPETYGFYDSFSAFDNLDFLGTLSGMTSSSERKKRISELLEFLGLAEKAETKVGEFSLGMKQKLALAQALLHRPKLLILDEPTLGLDPASQYEIRQLIKELARQGYTIFISSHLLFEVEDMCREVGIIDRGKLLIQDSIENLRRRVATSGTTVEIECEEIKGEFLEEAKKSLKLEAIEVKGKTIRARFTGGVPATSELVSLLVGAGAKIKSVKEHAPSLEEIFLKLTKEG